jgi:hypothetical protein
MPLFLSCKKEEFEKANARADRMQATTPAAISARYDLASDRIVVGLNNGLEISFPAHDAQGLETATPEQLNMIEINPSGFGLHWPQLDADLYVPALLEGVFGSARWMAARLGQLGGQVRSKAKAAASRKNGKLGGRPRKQPRRPRHKVDVRPRKKA